jgi:hypothetical protein
VAEIETRISDEEKVNTTNIDLNEVIKKVRMLVRNVKGMPGNELPVDISLEGFNFSVGQKDKNFRLVFGLDLGVKRKEVKKQTVT